jgi:hypothetical protein
MGALITIYCWVLLTWLTYAFGILCQDDVIPGEFFTRPMCMPIIFGLGTSTHVCL